MSNPLSIDVLVVTHSRDLVLSCLEHLSRQTLPHTVYLADNTDNVSGTTDAVQDRFPAIRVTRFAENQGFGRAVNHLATLGDGEAIVLVNDDLDVEPSFLEALLAPFEDPHIGMTAGLSLQPCGHEVVDGFGIEVDSTLLAFNRLRHRSPDERPGDLLGPSGGAAAYRRTAWEFAGGFDSRFFAYSEDLDLALRLRIAGWAPAACSGARGVHLGGATTGVDSLAQRGLAGFGRGFILRRYGVMRSRHAPRALLIELLTVLTGAMTARTLVPLTSRAAGWRAAGHSPRLPIPADAVDRSITFAESLRRLRSAR